MENEIHEFVLEREGCPIHYWVGGEEKTPLVVFTHGAYIDHREWQNTLPLVIDAGYRVLTWDLRGHGLSRPGTFKLTTALDDLLAILDLLKVQQATFVGHSMGGNIGQELVFRHPERVKSLVLLGCTWNFQKLTPFEEFSVKVGVPMLGWYPYQTLIKQMAEVTAYKEESRAYLREAFSVLSKPEFVQVMSEATACLHNEPDYVIPKPFLLMVGDKDRTGNIRKVAPMFAKHEPNCTFVLVPNAMHGFNLDTPEVFHKYLLEFLKKNA
jgi:pimeloyl-ACP methyl ester carboxylesterase